MMKSIACSFKSFIGFSDHDNCTKATENDSHLTNDVKASPYKNSNSQKQQTHSSTGKMEFQVKSEDSEDDCCTDSIVKFNCLDKCVNQNANASLTGLLFVAVVSNFLFIDIFKGPAIDSYTFKLPYFHPPAPDIRVFIQSFQI